MEIRECCFRTIPEKGRRLVWEITHTCYFGCDYCFQAQKRVRNPTRVLSEKDIFTICHTLPDLDVTEVLITGGEIFHVSEIIDLVCTALTSLNIPYSFSTSMLTNSAFVDRLLSYDPRSVNISFDPEALNRTRVYTNHLKSVENLLQKTETTGVEIKATGVIHSINFMNYEKYLEDIMQLCEKYESLKAVYITNPYDIGYIKSNIRLKKPLLDDIVKKTMNIESDKIKLINFPLFNKSLQKCPASKFIHLEPTGNLYPCHLLSNLSNDNYYMMGNILNEKSNIILDNLNSFAKQIDEAIDDYKRNTPRCNTCKSRVKCGGGCIAEIVAAGNMMEPQLICKHIPYPDKDLHKVYFTNSYSLYDGKNSDLTQDEEDKIKEYVFANIKKQQHDLAHSYDHVISVVQVARMIAKREKANLRIVTAASYFHDFSPRRKLIFEGHTKLSASYAIKFLRSIGFAELELEDIYKCIDTSTYGAAEQGHKPLSKEAQIVRDADLLDAIGARGIARVFAFASAHNCETLGKVEWDIDNPPKKKMSLVGPDPSPIYHFFSKLLWVRNHMATPYGRKLADRRHKVMVRFLKEYKHEMEVSR